MICRFTHDPLLRARFPRLHVATLVVTDIDKIDLAALHPAPLEAVADARLSGATESELPEIRAWRAAFTEMGLKPTQYRCAAEAMHEKAEADLVRMVEVLSATFRGAGAAVEPNASWSGDATREPRT